MVLDGRENAELSDKKIRRAIRHFLSAYLDILETHTDGQSVDDIHVEYQQKPIGPFMQKVPLHVRLVVAFVEHLSSGGRQRVT